MSATTTRRDFLKTGATVAGGLIVGFSIPTRALAQSAGAAASKLNAWVHVAAGGEPDRLIRRGPAGRVEQFAGARDAKADDPLRMRAERGPVAAGGGHPASARG